MISASKSTSKSQDFKAQSYKKNYKFCEKFCESPPSISNISASRYSRNLDSQFSSGAVWPRLVRFPDSARTGNRSTTLFRGSPSRQVRGLAVDSDETSGEAIEAWVHESSRLSQPGRRGAALHGPRRLLLERLHLHPQTELSFAAMKSYERKTVELLSRFKKGRVKQILKRDQSKANA